MPRGCGAGVMRGGRGMKLPAVKVVKLSAPEARRMAVICWTNMAKAARKGAKV